MTDEPKPLTAAELELLQSKSGVTGLSTVDIRRLLANSLRLRQLVIGAAKLLESHSTLTKKESRELSEEIKAEAKR